MKALIGYTGFVGGTIASQTQFDEQYNSKNIHEIAGKEFDLIVCAGAPGKKWLANQEPQQDLLSIRNLIEHLKTAHAKQVILMSTVDIFNEISGQNEETPIDVEALQPYGKHRYMLEQAVMEHFPKVTVIRLPALFGVGLKKNFIFDLIHNRMLGYTHPDSTFQFYNMARVWEDMQRAVAADLKLVTFATEPIRAGDIAEKALNITITPDEGAKPVHYDIKSVYADVFGGKNGYLYTKEQIMPEVLDLITSERAKL